ncbi:probable protein phosphatase 2C 62 [Malus sylvestris]|uniref:probable protein phosphatase 2C 62 n=1 Tax=Malus sylvestris TaxID=3752 RepID=UPI0021ABD583|nr:probable protein phosphatase 2C 62 [Malus sylvestris]
MKRRDPSLKFDEDSHKVKNTRLSPKAVLLNKMKWNGKVFLMRVCMVINVQNFGRDGLAKQITVDHDPQGEKDADLLAIIVNDMFQRLRIFRLMYYQLASLLKFIVILGNIPRVDGQLAMTRAFGDRKLQEHITSGPDITVKKIDAETDFIILVMSNQEAYDCIEELDDAQEAAEELIKEALSRKS